MNEPRNAEQRRLSPGDVASLPFSVPVELDLVFEVAG